ncbi:acyl-CoA thioesterase domain-containing protein [Streptomyces sp. AcE210]|uniref:acyl-CoA thioesterase n=1 Tax=Streptomyces sp. AcE210 TaxID=2292703 RepID=UPI001404CA19|nr:acyl-CoA thioesterase domain-containing protein [Streptomyces sp. AcE210]
MGAQYNQLAVVQPDATSDRADPLPLGELLGLVEASGDSAFTGMPHMGRPPRAFGGVTLAQALLAAGRTVDGGRQPHSLHAYFLRSVAPEASVAYEVERLRDGASYAARQVAARQDGMTVLSLSASFKKPESALDHQPEMPAAPAPDDCEAPYEAMAREHPERYAESVIPRAVDLRLVEADADELAARADGMSRRRCWLRAARPLPDEPLLHAAALAYLSDLTISPTAALPWEPHGARSSRRSRVMLASLDHAMWFHRPTRADAWLLYAQHTTNLSDGRAMSRGELWSQEGQLVASVVQEALIRHRPAVT